jgi:glycerophosphoryl diester phosphodiesterase
MQVFAHRGTSGHDPENTLRAFRGAIAAGADGIELDVHATADRVPVVIHDRDVARTTNGQGHVDELSLEQAKRLDAGDGEQIPTLAEVLELVGDRIRLYVEVKQIGIEREVLTALAAHPGARWMIGSFDLEVLRAFRAAADAELWIIALYATDEVFAAARALNATTLSLYAQTVDAEVAERCDKAGLDLAVWTVNEAALARSMRDLGAVAICTDFPAEIIDGLRAPHNRKNAPD